MPGSNLPSLCQAKSNTDETCSHTSLSEKGQQARIHYCSGGSRPFFDDQQLLDDDTQTDACNPAHTFDWERASQHLSDLSKVDVLSNQNVAADSAGQLNGCSAELNDPSKNSLGSHANTTSTLSSSYYLSESDWTMFTHPSQQSLGIQSGDSKYQPLALQEHPYDGLAMQMNMSGRCDENACDVDGCKQVKELMGEIKKSFFPNNKALNSTHENLMINVYEHCVKCCHPRCPYNWCLSHVHNKFSEDTLREKKVEEICSRIRNFVDTNLEQIYLSENCLFVKIDISIPFDKVIQEDGVWTRLCMMGRSSKSMLVKPHSQYSSESGQYWVIKKVKDFDSWEIYQKLRELEDPESVTPLLWAANCQSDNIDFVLVCSAFQGPSLQEYLQADLPLPDDLIVQILLQLLAAVKHLHALRIVYLNWTSKNILVSEDTANGLSVKIINFDRSVLLDEVEDARLFVPIHLSAPELLNREGVQLTSDVWGMGCLLFELIMGRPVWHRQRHLSLTELETVMKEQQHPGFPERYPHLQPVLKACWEVDPFRRTDIDGIRNLLENLESTAPMLYTSQ